VAARVQCARGPDLAAGLRRGDARVIPVGECITDRGGAVSIDITSTIDGRTSDISTTHPNDQEPFHHRRPDPPRHDAFIMTVQGVLVVSASRRRFGINGGTPNQNCRHGVDIAPRALYFKIYGVVKVLYVMGRSNAVTQVMAGPTYDAVMVQTWQQQEQRSGNGGTTTTTATTVRMETDWVVWQMHTEDFGDIMFWNVVTHVAGFSLGLTWLINALTVRDVQTLAFFSVTQDVFGARRLCN
jgi:hypothetical protein